MDKHDIRWGDWVRLVKDVGKLPKGTVGISHGVHGEDYTLAYVHLPGRLGNSEVRISDIERISVHQDELLEGDQLMLLEAIRGHKAGLVVTFRAPLGTLYGTVEYEKTHDVFNLPYTNLMGMKQPLMKSFAKPLRAVLLRATKILTGF